LSAPCPFPGVSRGVPELGMGNGRKFMGGCINYRP
jgi:hypothetical protein